MDIAIHIGQPKTASTALQVQLAQARPELARAGVCYSAAFGTTKARLLPDLVRGRRRKAGDFERASALFAEELRGCHRTLVLSDENLFSLDDRPMRLLRARVAAGGGTPRIYAYVRRPEEHVVSLHQLVVRGFSREPLDAFIRRQLTSRYYLHKRRLDRWSAVFGRAAINVRLFHRSTLKGSPAQDFLQWIGLDPLTIPTVAASSARRHNDSLDATSVEVLRLMNDYHVEHAEEMSDHFMLEFRAATERMDSGRRSTGIPDQARQLLKAIRADSEAFAAEYLSGEEAAIYLAPLPDQPGALPPDIAAILKRALAVLASLGARWRRDAATLPAMRQQSGLPDAILKEALGGEQLDPDAEELIAWLGFPRNPPSGAKPVATPDESAAAFRRLMALVRGGGYLLTPLPVSSPSTKKLRSNAARLATMRATATKAISEEA